LPVLNLNQRLMRHSLPIARSGRKETTVLWAARDVEFSLREVQETKPTYRVIMNALFNHEGERSLTTSHGTTLTTVTLNSPDPPALARFYAQLLGWEIGTEEPGWVTLKNPGGGIGMAFHIEDIYVRPSWPAKPGEQQMMMHLEIEVVDLEAGCAHAKACGATLAGYQPQDDVRVHLDPDGHPFCLYIG